MNDLNTSKEQSKYSKYVTIAGYASIATATLLILIKFFVLFLTESSTIFASLTDSLMDVTAALINMFAIKYSLHPADKHHRYGHGKAEAIAGLVQAAFISGSACILIFHGMSRVITPVELNNLDVGVAMTVVATILTAFLIMFQSYVIKKTDSQVIIADRLHYTSDIFFNIGVLLSLVLSQYGIMRADGVFAIILGIYIFIGVIRVIKLSLSMLLDQQLPEHQEQNILQIITSVEGVIGIHDLRTRRSGSTIFIQGHLEINQNLTLKQAHDITDKTEEAIHKSYENVDITFHMEPFQESK